MIEFSLKSWKTIYSFFSYVNSDKALFQKIQKNSKQFFRVLDLEKSRQSETL